MAGRAVRGDGQHAGGAAVHPAADLSRPGERRSDFDSSRGTGRGRLEVRAPQVSPIECIRVQLAMVFGLTT